jgi:hypothetical protein
MHKRFAGKFHHPVTKAGIHCFTLPDETGFSYSLSLKPSPERQQNETQAHLVLSLQRAG